MTDPLFESLEEASICWDKNGTPFSNTFDDLYFSRQGGLAETRYVFIGNNNLPARWQQSPDNFTVAETGFGTGLNFLAAADLWLRSTTAGVLHYLATEKHPIEKIALSRLYAQWAHFSHLTTDLLAQLPPPVSGIHRLLLAQGRIRLSLLWGDSQEQLAALRGSDHADFRRARNPAVDAWFLDGFAPAKNPQMWTPELFQSIADLSRPGTTFSTFTAAGLVRRGLQQVGFTVNKTKGFGSKREMLVGAMESLPTPVQDVGPRPHRFNSPHQPPWYMVRSKLPKTPATAAVIGAGIAGCSTAHALAQRNIKVTLFEQHNTVAAEASGNLQGIIYPKLSARKSPLARFSLAALIHACRFYLPYWQDENFGRQSGVISLPEHPQEADIFQSIARQFPETLVRLLDNAQLREISGLDLQSGTGLWFPHAGWIKPPAICEVLSRHPNITAVRNSRITDIRHDGKWHALDQSGKIICTADILVIACGTSANHFEATHHLPLKSIRGQITYLPATPASAQLQTVICGTGYLAPAVAGLHTLGATYDIGATTESLQTVDHKKNIAQLEQTDAALKSVLATEIDENTEGRVAFRCTTPDYLPIAGPAPIWQDFIRDYAPLRDNARTDIPIAGSVWPNLYINCGHGSRGLSYAPLCAELIAAQICGETPPLELALRRAIHPGRFIIRDLKRARAIPG